MAVKTTGEMMIFSNDKGFSTSISNKKEDGTYDNMFIAVNFKKGVSVENKSKINVTNGFLSFYKTKDGLAKPKIVIMEFEGQNNTSNNEVIVEDDLPF